MKSLKSIPYRDECDSVCLLDIYLPDEAAFPVFIYFHGGGIVSGDRTMDTFYSALAQKGIAVVTADYRMYPTAKYPEFIEDAAAAVNWVNSNMNSYGTVTGCFVGGSSAGGYISQMLCFDKSYLAVYGIDSDNISGYVHDAGQPTTHFNVLGERKIDTRRVIIDEMAPIYHITGDRDYAPMQIIVSDNDIPNRLEQTQLLVATLKQFDYDENRLDFRVMKNSDHCSYINKQNDNGDWIFAEMIYDFISEHNSTENSD